MCIRDSHESESQSYLRVEPVEVQQSVSFVGDPNLDVLDPRRVDQRLVAHLVRVQGDDTVGVGVDINLRAPRASCVP